MKRPWLDGLNAAQRRAVEHGDGPLLIVAGAGTGKTRTLAARVAALIARGVSSDRILLLTFTRRAAAEMLDRAAGLLAAVADAPLRVWGGTFHSVAVRLLRVYAAAAGLDPQFTVLDPSDAADVIDVLRHELGVAACGRRFPRKATCLAIYSRCANADAVLDDVLAREFPWCAGLAEPLRRLFAAYVEHKQRRHLLDFDDLLLYWRELAASDEVGPLLDARFDHILVDEYQDTNVVQAGILAGLRRRNRNLTVVGDEAQSIFRFRGADAANMLRFRDLFPDAAIVSLERNYRSVQPILDAANRVLAERPAGTGFDRSLRAVRPGGAPPGLVACADERDESRWIAETVLRHAEEGIPLRRMAVLMRAADHSDVLELELARRNIPFRKYGGLRFLDIAHVKDLLALLRLAVNPLDQIAAFRAFQLLPGVGPATAAALWKAWTAAGHASEALAATKAPPAARPGLAALGQMLADLRRRPLPPAAAVERARDFYRPLCDRLYERAEARQKDLDSLARLAAGYERLSDFLTDLALDPPAAGGDVAGPPVKDEDWLVLSTIHSAKGGEWDVVILLHAADGCLPADMSAGSAEELEEERRLLYVAMTRARDALYITWPQRFHVRGPSPTDRHVLAPLCRFLTPAVIRAFVPMTSGGAMAAPALPAASRPVRGLQERLRRRWSPPDSGSAPPAGS